MIKKFITFFKTFYFQLKFKSDLFLSRIIYGNLTGFNLNREGLKRWKNNKKIFKKNENQRLVGDAFPLGYHLFQIDNQSLLEAIIKKYNQIIDSSEHTFIYDQNGTISSAENGKFFMLKNIIGSIPEVIELLSECVFEKLYRYYRCHFLVTHVAAYRTVNLPMEEGSKEVYAYKLHVDRHPSDTMKLFVNLSHVNLEDGPLNFFDRVNSKKVLKKGYKERDNYGNAQQIIQNSTDQVFLIGKAGTAGIVDTTSCFHKAGIPSVGRTRDLLVFNFESASVPLDILSETTKETIRRKIDYEYSTIK